MIGPTPAERQAAGHATTESALRRKTALLAPLAALGLAAAAIGGAYATSNRSTPASPRANPGITPTQADTAPTLQGAFPAEPGPEGVQGQWIGDLASVSIGGFKQSWIAFRALSLRRDRTLSVTSARGQSFATHIGVAPSVYMAGPFPEGVISLHPAPGAVVASRGDRRRLSVFLSTLRTYPEPLAALPGAGFWGIERAPGVAFNWLRDAGVVDIYAPRTTSTHIWLTFVGRSLGADRTLTASSGQTTSRVLIGTSAHLVRIGPFPLVHGRAHVLMSPSPGARRYAGDARPLSIQVALLAAHTSATEE